MANRKLNSIKFPDIADTYILDAGKVEYHETDTFDADTVGKALQTKANIDGSYESMTVGNAEQLVSNVRVNDKTPYLFRTSGGSVDIGDREYVNGIVGGTVAWNQLVQNGNFADTTKWSKASGTLSVANNIGTFTATAAGQYHGIYQSLDVKNGHKYFVNVGYKVTTTSSSATRMRVVFSNGANGDTTWIANGSGWQNASYIKAMTSDWSQMYIITEYSLTINVGDTIDFKNIQVIDLTQMFGSTIADYIYSLEQANAGAGVAWFKKLFPKPYYAYTAGELKSVSGLVSHDMAGFNQWDEEWEVGSIDSTTGENAASDNYWRSKNYVRVIPNTTYYVTYPSAPSTHGALRMRAYDANKGYIGIISATTNNALTIDSHTHYIRFAPDVAVLSDHNICINIAWDNSRNGEYEPYELHSYPLDSDLTLRGVPCLDANNGLYYNGDIYEADGTVTRRFTIRTFDGSETWGNPDSSGYCWYQLNNLKPSTDYKKTMIATIPVAGSRWAMSAYDYCVGGWENGTPTENYIYIRAGNISTASELKTWLESHPVTVVYELQTPTTETADAYVGTQIVSDFGTEEFVIDSDIAVPIPVGTDTDYPVNLVAKLEMAPNSPDGSGDYIVRQTNGMNEYVPLVIEDALPTIPSTAGSYKLTVTVAEGSDPVLSWTAE